MACTCKREIPSDKLRIDKIERCAGPAWRDLAKGRLIKRSSHKSFYQKNSLKPTKKQLRLLVSSGSATGTKDSTKPSKLGKFGEIDRVYQLRAAVGGANLPLRLVPGRGGETPPGMWGQRV